MLNDSGKPESQAELFISPEGVRKADRYKWAKIGAVGELAWAESQQLLVDPAYQRPVNDAKVKGIAGEFTWPAFGVLIVAVRPDGAMFVMEGQHRLAAALKRGIKRVPVIKFQIDDTRVEARAFLSSNTYRKPLTSIDKHKAKVLSGEAAAQLVDDLMKQYGRFAYNGDKAGGIHCVSKLEYFASVDPDTLRKLWPLMMELSKDRSLQEKIVGALMYIERHALAGCTLVDPVWSKKLVRIGFVELVNAANRMASAFARGGDKVWAQGILAAMNKGQKRRRFAASTITDGAGE